MEVILQRQFDNILSDGLQLFSKPHRNDKLTPNDELRIHEILESNSVDQEILELVTKLSFERESLLKENSIMLSELIKEHGLKRIYR